MLILNAIADAAIVRMFYEKTDIKLNVLIAYNNLSGQAYKLACEYREMINYLYLDSGAYAVNTGKATINISEYKQYIKKFGHYFDEIFSLDKYFDNPFSNQTIQEYFENELEGKSPIPVVHDTVDPYSEFKQFADKGYYFIAFGSKKKINKETFGKLKNDYPHVYIHMFGDLNRKMLQNFRPYSCDSSSWAQKQKYGKILYWDKDEKKEYEVDLGERQKSDSKYPIHKSEKVKAFLKDTFNWEYTDLLNRPYRKMIVNLYFYKQLESALTNGEI